MVKAFSLPGYINIYQESDNNESEFDKDDHSEHIFDYEDDVLELLSPTRSSCFCTHSPTCSKGWPKTSALMSA